MISMLSAPVDAIMSSSDCAAPALATPYAGAVHSEPVPPQKPLNVRRVRGCAGTLPSARAPL